MAKTKTRKYLNKNRKTIRQKRKRGGECGCSKKNNQSRSLFGL